MIDNNTYAEIYGHRPPDTLTPLRRSATWGEPGYPVTEKLMPGITPGQGVHYVPISATIEGGLCQAMTISEVWDMSTGTVNLCTSYGQTIHQVGYSATPVGHSWHFTGQCDATKIPTSTLEVETGVTD